jgi:hypothetical protein
MSTLLNRIRVGFQDVLARPMDLLLPPGQWVMGINLGGPPVEIQGQRWMGYEEAMAAGLKTPQAQCAKTARLPRPRADPAVREMLNSVIFRPRTLELSQPLPVGSYQVYLWIMENYQSRWHQLQLRMQGQIRAEGLGDLEVKVWQRYGPYAVELQGEDLQLSLDTGKDGVDAHLMGLSICRSS